MTAVAGEQRCIHDMLPGQCSWCRHLDDEMEVASALRTGGRDRSRPSAPRRRVAQFDSWCPAGDRPHKIRAGDLVVHDQSEGYWTCLDCAEAGT